MKRWGQKIAACLLAVCMVPWPPVVHGEERGQPEEGVFSLLERGTEDRPITRAEAAALVVRAFGGKEEAELRQYADVPEGSWYRQDMARVTAMEVMQGHEGKLRPQDVLTEGEAALMFQRLFCLDPLPEQQSQNNEPITRGEFVRLGNQLAPQRLTAGAQGWQLEGNTLISQSGEYSQLVVMGDLILTEGVGEQVHLEDVVIYGRLVVRGSGQVTVTGTSWADQVFLSSASRSIRLESAEDCVMKAEVQAPMATLSGAFSQVNLRSDGGRLVLDQAQVENLQMLGQQNVVMVSSGSVVRQVESRGEQGAIMGTGQVEQVRAYGNNLYVETSGTQVIALPGSDDIWAGGVLLDQGSLVTPGEEEEPVPSLPPEQPEESGSWNGGGQEEQEEISPPSQDGEVEEPDKPQEEIWPADTISLDSGHTSQPISSVQSQRDGTVQVLTLEMGEEDGKEGALAWGYPSQEARDAFQGRDPRVPFAVAALRIVPGGTLKEDGVTTVSWNSKTLLAMGYSKEDSGSGVTYRQEGEGMTREWQVENSQLEQGLLVFLSLSSLDKQIPLTVTWNGETAVSYRLDVSVLTFRWMSPPELTWESGSRGPGISLAYQREGRVDQSVLRLVSAQEPQQEYGRWESGSLEAGPVEFSWTLTGEQCPPLEEELRLVLEETCGQEQYTWETKLTITGEQLRQLLPGEGEMFVLAAGSDSFTSEQTQVLEGMWDEEGQGPFAGLLSFEGQTLQVNTQKAQGLGDWCQEHFGRRELPVTVYTTVLLPGLDTGSQWIRPVLWLDADRLGETGLDCVAAEEGPALFILRRA